MMKKSVSILKGLQNENGLFPASKLSVETGYNRAWIRDNIYASLGLEAINDYSPVIKTYQALLDIMLKHEEKINWAIAKKPIHRYQYIHARYDTETMDEIWDEWGNKQNDSVGALLFKIGDLQSKGIKIIRGDDDIRILQKLVQYLNSIEYWHDKDNGIWEENEEVHASSIGACVAGLKKISKIVDVPNSLIKKGKDALNKLLPRESITKDVDLALLSLIYPYNIVNKKQKEQILRNVEKKLVREKGVIRYMDDYYYNKDGEAEWTFGFPWLAIIYKQMNMSSKFIHYMKKTIEVINEDGEMPELYFAGTDDHNENSPLSWAQALFLVMLSA